MVILWKAMPFRISLSCINSKSGGVIPSYSLTQPPPEPTHTTTPYTPSFENEGEQQRCIIVHSDDISTTQQVSPPCGGGEQGVVLMRGGGKSRRP